MDLKSSMSAMFGQIEEIVDTAERVAADIRRQADSQASERLERSRREAELLVSDQLARTRRLVRTLRAQLRDLADEAEAIERGFEEAVASRPDLTGPRVDRAEDDTSGPPAPAPVGYPGTGRRVAEPNRESGHAPSDPDREAALVRGFQLAGAGESRERIEASLRNEFRLEDTRSLVDEILARR
jgi:hypothetical protein